MLWGRDHASLSHRVRMGHANEEDSVRLFEERRGLRRGRKQFLKLPWQLRYPSMTSDKSKDMSV